MGVGDEGEVRNPGSGGSGWRIQAGFLRSRLRSREVFRGPVLALAVRREVGMSLGGLKMPPTTSPPCEGTFLPAFRRCFFQKFSENLLPLAHPRAWEVEQHRTRADFSNLTSKAVVSHSVTAACAGSVLRFINDLQVLSESRVCSATTLRSIQNRYSVRFKTFHHLWAREFNGLALRSHGWLVTAATARAIL